ncbi:MAG: ABC transporter permease [Thermoanaerobaculia bacterium]|nr:ABC transporter permease [Thermoanaerobaculia bacterium]
MNRSAFLLRELVSRELRSRYAGSAFGFLWAFVHPLWQLVLLSLVFSVILRIPLTGEHTTSFAAFLFAGLLPWSALQEGVTRGATVITENGQLVKKMRFPSQLLVHSVVISAVLHAGIAFVVFALLQGARGELELRRLPWLLLGLVGQLAMTSGVALGVAALQVYLRDVVQGIGLVLSALFYLTPIVYTERFVLASERAPRALAGWLEFSPLSTMVRLFRTVLVSSDPPGPTAVAVMLATGGVLLVAGGTIFRRLSGGFADEL